VRLVLRLIVGIAVGMVLIIFVISWMAYTTYWPVHQWETVRDTQIAEWKTAAAKRSRDIVTNGNFSYVPVINEKGGIGVEGEPDNGAKEITQMLNWFEEQNPTRAITDWKIERTIDPETGHTLMTGIWITHRCKCLLQR
jgi:hypothetical protein